MSEETNDTSDNTDEPEHIDTTEFYESLQRTTDFYGAPDRLLQKLSDSADVGGSGAGIPITLYLHGGMIAGHIISGQKFYRAMGDVFREGITNARPDGDLPEAFDDFAKWMFDDVADDVDKAIAEDNRRFDEDGTKTSRWILTRQIYLENVYYTVPGATSYGRSTACVRLSEVVGWALGIQASNDIEFPTRTST